MILIFNHTPLLIPQSLLVTGRFLGLTKDVEGVGV